MRLSVLIVPALLLLSACAGTMASPEGSYSSQLRQLADECRARGGILSPTGATTGRVETENVCKINGQAVRAGN